MEEEDYQDIYHDFCDDHYYDDEEPEKEYGCNCGYFCMDCLGMSWRDFM